MVEDVGDQELTGSRKQKVLTRRAVNGLIQQIIDVENRMSVLEAKVRAAESTYVQAAARVAEVEQRMIVMLAGMRGTGPTA